MSALLQARALTKRFGGLAAVQDLGLEVEQGVIHALIGPNGAGKTTLLNVLSGITPRTSGEVVFGARRIDGLRPYEIARLGVGRTFQVPRLFGDLSVLENVMVGYHCRSGAGLLSTIAGAARARAEEQRIASIAREALRLVGLEGEAERAARSVTFVQQRLVEIARALVLEPTLLLLDEPAAGMNATEVGQLERLLNTIRGRGVTVLFIEHHMRMVMNVADRITVLDFGRKIAEGAPAAVRNDPAVLEAYLGKRAHAGV